MNPTAFTWKMSEAEPAFIPYPRPEPGAPNVLVVVLDDVGFGQLGCFGSPVETPHIDRLAQEGLRYNRFHVTSICSSTRAALLSGRNHHAVGMGATMETPMGLPGYSGRIPKSAALLPRILRDGGYSTMALGKWHLCPQGEYSQSGPMDRWPLGLGFQRFYGFLGAETSQWDPPLVQDNTFIDPPKTPGEGYHLSEDLADHAIRMILDQQQATPGKPFFCYVATGAAHAPHQAPPSWIARYRGRFDEGWEAVRQAIFERQLAEGVVPQGTLLTERPPWVQPWNELSPDERRLFARYMEVFAGFLSHADAQIGRILSFLRDRSILDRTLVMLLSDNGASSEGSHVGTINEPNAWMARPEGVRTALAHIDDLGGQRAFNHYPFAWAWAGNTPLQLWKRYAWLGGVRTPMIVRWPGRVEGPGAVRPQFCHAVDVFSTVLDATGIEPPAVVDGVTQQPIDGASILPTLSDPGLASPRTTQYFEMHGSRGIYHDGWKATTNWVSPLFNERDHVPGSHDLDRDHWGLFNLDEDFAEVVDLSAKEPERLERLKAQWWAEAGRNNVLPLMDGADSSIRLMHPGEYPTPAEMAYVPGGTGICEAQVPAMMGGFRAEAEIDVPENVVPTGVLCALGDLNGGWSFYLVAGRPATCLVSGTGQGTRLVGSSPIGAGRHTVAVRYRPADSPHNLFLEVDGDQVASGHHEGQALFLALRTAGARMLVGRDGGLPFNDDYEPPSPFTGTLHRVVIRSDQPVVPPAEIVAAAAGD